MEFNKRFKTIPLMKALDINELREMGLKFGLIYYFDEVILKELDDIPLDKERMIEARFFNKEKEVHIFKRDEMEAILFEEDQKEDIQSKNYLDEHYLIVPNDRDRRMGSKICMRNYFLFDDDKQAYIGYTRPFDVIS